MQHVHHRWFLMLHLLHEGRRLRHTEEKKLHQLPHISYKTKLTLPKFANNTLLSTRIRKCKKTTIKHFCVTPKTTARPPNRCPAVVCSSNTISVLTGSKKLFCATWRLLENHNIFLTIIWAQPLQQLQRKTPDLRLQALNDSQDRLRCYFILLCFFCSFWFVIIVKTVEQRLKDRVWGKKGIFN